MKEWFFSILGAIGLVLTVSALVMVLGEPINVFITWLFTRSPYLLGAIGLVLLLASYFFTMGKLSKDK